MFEKNKKEKGQVTIVTTKEQLKAAVTRKDKYIEVKGDLAKKMKWMAKLSKKKVAMITAMITGTVAAAAAAPVTGGASLAVYGVTATAAAAVPVTGGASLAVAGLTSTEIMAIIGVLGGIVVMAILNNYNIEADAVNGVLKLTKNK